MKKLDPDLERLRIAKEILDSAKEIPGIDTKWLERCYEMLFYRVLGKSPRKETFTQDDLPFLERAFRMWAERKKIPIRQDILVFKKEGSRYLLMGAFC